MKIKISKSQWEKIGKTAGWTKNAQIIPDDGFADGRERYTDEEMDLIEKQKVDAIKAENDRPKKIQDLMELYASIHPQASEYEFNTLMSDIGQISTEEINRYIDKYVYNWGKKPKQSSKSEDVTIFELVANWEPEGYGIALISPDDIVVTAYIDPSDYPDMILDKNRNGAKVIGGKYKGYSVRFHSGGLEELVGKDWFTGQHI